MLYWSVEILLKRLARAVLQESNGLNCRISKARCEVCSMLLNEYGEDLAYEIAFWMQGLANPDYPFDELGKLSMEVSSKLRALAIEV